MLLGCCMNLVASGPDRTGVEHLDELCEAGYDYVEFPCAEMATLDEFEFNSILNKVLDSGMPCTRSNNLFPPSIRLTGEHPDDFSVIKEYLHKAVGRQKSLGVNTIVFGSGAAKRLPDGFEYEKGWEQLVELTIKIADIFSQYDMDIAIEPLRKAECNIINTFEDGCRFADAVSKSNVKMLVDFYHLYLENEPVENIVKYGKENLIHVHFSNPDDRVFPTLNDRINYKPFFDALKDIDYKGTISCEAYTNNFLKDAEITKKLFETLG